MNLSADDIKTIVGFLSLFLVPVSHFLYNLMLSKMTSTRQSQLRDLTGVVVAGVEQSYQGVPGTTKKAAASATLTALAKGFGLKITPVEADAFIEAAVMAMNAVQSSSASDVPALVSELPNDSVPSPAQGQDGAL